MATADLFHVSKENTNFSRLCKLLIDGGTQVLREVFDNIHPPTLLKSHLLDPANHVILKTLKYKKVLYKEQWDKLYPAGGSTVTSSSFDITLLCVLLRNICHLKTPSAGWNKLPLPTSTNTEDDVVRIRLYRNHLYGHIKDAAISDSDFTNYWNHIKSVLVRLGGTHYQSEIEKLRIESMDPEDGKYVIQCLEEWVKNDDRIMDALDELAEKVEKTQHEEAEKTRHELAKKMDENQQQSAEKTAVKLDELKHQLLSEIDEREQELMKGHVIPYASQEWKLPDIGLCSKRLQTSTKSQTEFQPKLMATHSVSRARTDEIFTNFTIERGRKGVRNRSKVSRSEHLDEYSQPRGTPIKTWQDIFNTPEKDTPNPKSILVVGKPGIGKSLFCQKLVRDWANDILFQNQFDLVYLLTFRQLHQLGKRTNELNFCEVLNHSPLLDQSSIIDESLFKYMNEHQDKVLFILDGYDEYANRMEIFNSLEQEYENNPEISMPVSAIVSKIMRKKIFSDATVMVTSRPREAEELGGIDFDAMVEILGFSPKQVDEFIVKYFQSIKHEEFTNALSKHIMKNPDLLSVAHIPMMCFLICWCMDWNIESKKEKNLPVNRITDDLPVTITDLYSEVVRIFEIKHHSKPEYRTTELPRQFEIPPVVANTWYKLSKLAAQTMIEKQFIFQESDLKKFDIASKEVELLTASGLFTCGPGLRETPFTLTRDICFSHLTFHEYFAALEFVRNKEMPPEIESYMVFQFMAGGMAKEKNAELFPIVSVPLSMMDDMQELSDSPLEKVALVYRFNMPYSFGLGPYKELETLCLDNSLYLKAVAEDLTKLSLVTSKYIITLEPSDDIDIYSLVKCVSSRMALDVSTRTASPKQLTLDSLFYLYNIAALCFLLEAVLIIESTRTVCLICRNLLDILILRNRLDESEDDPHKEFYQNFYGLLSWFLSYKQVSISGVSTSLLTIVTCGRQSKSYGDDVIMKPLFKKIDLEEDDCQEASEKPKLQPFCVVFFRSSDLLDIGELRTIHERNSKNVFSLISPQDCILIEVVPEISQSLTNLANAFDLLETSLRTSAEVESNSAEEPTNKLLLYSHAYQKQCIFAADTEPAVYSAVLHHQFTFKNLVREVRKSSKKTELLFKKPQHGLLTIVSKDHHVDLRLEVLSSEPSGSDVIPNDVTKIVDDVIEKCSDHFGVSVNPNNPWRELDDRNAEPVGRENDDDDIQSILAAKLKLEDENIDLKNKVQELTELSEELQDKVAYLEIGKNRFSRHDNVDGDSATGSSLSEPRALTPSSHSQKATSSSFTQNYDALSTFHDQPHASNGNVAFVSPNGVPLCDGESVQTNSLSIEYNNDEMLKEIGGSQFYRERAERKVLMVSTIPQYIQELKKKRNASIQNGHTSFQVPSGIKLTGHLYRAQYMEDTNCSTSGINEATNASSFKCIDSLPEEKLMSQNVMENWKECAKHFEDTTSPSADMMKGHSSDDDREYQTHFESWPEVSGYSSVDTLTCDSLPDNESEFKLCTSQTSQNNDETDFLSLPQKSEVTSNCQSSSPYTSYIITHQHSPLQEDDSERSTDKMDENLIMSDGPSSSSKIPDATNSLSDVNILTDSKLPDQQKCYQDSNPHFFSQPVNSSSKGYSENTLTDLKKPSSRVIQNGVEHLSIKSSLEDDRKKVNKSRRTEVHDVAEVERSTRIECDVIPDGPSHIMIDSIDGQRHKKSRTYVHNTTESSKKREIEGGDNIIADGPSFFKRPSIQSNGTMSNEQSSQVKIDYASLVGPPPVVDTKFAGKSKVDGERVSVIVDQFYSLPSKLSQSSLSSQNSTASNCLTEIQEESAKDRVVIPVHQILENVESGANKVLNLKTSNYPQHRSLYQISESDDSGNVAKYTQAPSWDDQIIHSNGELLGLDRSFLSRHSRDSTLRKGVFPGGHQGDYRSLPVFDHRKIEETSSLRLKSYGMDGPAHVGQVVPKDRQSPQIVSNAENTTQLVSQRDNYRTNSLVNQPLKSPFPTEYILPDMSTKTRVHYLQPQLSFTPSSSPPYMIERMSSVRPRDSNNMSTEPMKSGDNMSTEPMKSGDNMSTEPMKSGDNISTEPMKSGDNISTEPMKSGDNIFTEPMKSGDNISTEPMKSGDNMATEPMRFFKSAQPMKSSDSNSMSTEPIVSGVSNKMPIKQMRSGVSNKSSQLMGSGVSDKSSQQMGSGVSDNTSTELMGPGVSANKFSQPMGLGVSNKSSQPMVPGVSDNKSSQPMGSGVSDNTSSQPMGSGISHNTSTELMGPGVSANKFSEPMGLGVSNKSSQPMVPGVSDKSSQPMGSGVSDNTSSQPMGSGVSHNMPTEEKGSVISDIPTESMSNISADSPSHSNTMSNDESCDTEDGYIKSLEETVTRYKTTLNSLMTEATRAAKREREQKRKREQEKIERQLELRRQKARDNGSPQPAKLPIQESLGDIEGSCQHFKRGCDVFFPCCNMYYPCHRCHNSSDQCDQDDSKAGNATLIRCRTCMTEQEITIESHHCKNCNKKLSEYFCGICKHFTADEKKPYHCAPCGICRIHRDNSFHCDVCNVCLNQRLRGKHKCRPDSGHDECCICLEDAFSGCQVLPCSHKVHRECAVAMLKNGVKTCPVCRSPIYQN